MATNIQKEAQRLFGNPTNDSGLVVFDPQTYSKSLDLPGTEDISGPSPFAAIATREDRTYSPPSPRAVDSLTTGLEEDTAFTPAYMSDINIAAPGIGDVETINDIPGLENVSKEAQQALGIFGLTPTSLTRSFSNFSNLDITNLGVNAFNLATSNTALAGLLGVADKAISGAFNNAISRANPMELAQLGVLATNLMNLDFDKLGQQITDIPGQIEQNVEALIDGLAAFVDAPLETLQDFGELAGTYAQYGTMSPTVNSLDVNGINHGYVTNQRGEVVTTPGFVKATLGMSPISSVAQFANVLGELFSGESAQEKASREMANMEIAAQMPSFFAEVNVPSMNSTVGVSVTSVPDMLSTVGHMALDFTDVVGIRAADVPGLPFDININLAEFERTGVISGAVIGNVFDPIDFEDQQIAEDIAAAVEAAKGDPNSAFAISNAFADAVQAIGMAEYQNQMGVADETVDFNLSGQTQHSTEAKSMAAALGFEAISEAINSGRITDPETFGSYLDEVAPQANLGTSAAAAEASSMTTQGALASALNTELGFYTAFQAVYASNLAKGIAMDLQPGFGKSRIDNPHAMALMVATRGQAGAVDYNAQAPDPNTVAAMEILGFTNISMNLNQDLDKKAELAAMLSILNREMRETRPDIFGAIETRADFDYYSELQSTFGFQSLAAAIEAINQEPLSALDFASSMGAAEAFSGMEGAQGSFDAGFGSLSAEEAQAAYDHEQLSDIETATSGVATGSYGAQPDPGSVFGDYPDYHSPEFDPGAYTGDPEGGPEGGGKSGGKGGEAQAGGDFDMTGITSGPGEDGEGSGGGDPGNAGGYDGGSESEGGAGTYICTAAFKAGVSPKERFRQNKKYGIKMRREDPVLMRGYDIVGPWIAKKIGHTKLGNSLTKIYAKKISGEKLSVSQKALETLANITSRPVMRLIGRFA